LPLSVGMTTPAILQFRELRGLLVKPHVAQLSAAPPNDDQTGDVLRCPIFFYHRRQRVLASLLDVALDVGRQREGEPSPAVRIERAQGARVVLAPIDDVAVSRSHALVEPTADNQVKLANASRTATIRLSPHGELGPGESIVAAPPIMFHFGTRDSRDMGEYAVRIDPPEEEELSLEALPERTAPPGKRTDPASLARMTGAFAEESLLQWLETVLAVFQSAASAHDFPELAAMAAVRIVGLDAAAMLRADEEGRWRIEAIHAPYCKDSQATWTPSQTLLARVRRERRTFRYVPLAGADTPHSLLDVSALVAAPILSGDGEVIGALYGDRRGGSRAPGAPEISAFEAKLVELLASGIAAGLARIKEEQAALAARVQFEQFFTPQLAAQLERDPQLLVGRNAEVTLLFADIRGFSRMSERLGPAGTMDLIQDVMGVLSECVLSHEGVLVDYLGDELMAMWGAPAPQADHAVLACRAARQMMHSLDELSERWLPKLGEPIRLGIGINSGVARVGNTGSPQKFKYGPLGDVVNVASRLQGATKYLGAHCLTTGETLSKLPAGLPARRLARVRVVNIEHPIELYEIRDKVDEGWEERCRRYNEALTALEADQLATARELAEGLRGDFVGDEAIAALVERISSASSAGPTGETSVWQLPGK
jgi:adenylate cyclase